MSVWIQDSKDRNKFVEIDSVYKCGVKISKIYKGSELVFPSLSGGILCREPDYDNAYSLDNNTIYYANDDIWVSRSGYQDAESYVYISKDPTIPTTNRLLINHSGYHSRYTGTKGGDIVYIPRGWYYQIYAVVRVLVPTKKVNPSFKANTDKYVPAPDYEGDRISLPANNTYMDVPYKGGCWVYLQPTSTSAKVITVKLNETGAEYVVGQSSSYSASGDKGSTMVYIPGKSKYSFKYTNASGWIVLGRAV